VYVQIIIRYFFVEWRGTRPSLVWCECVYWYLCVLVLVLKRCQVLCLYVCWLLGPVCVGLSEIGNNARDLWLCNNMKSCKQLCFACEIFEKYNVIKIEVETVKIL